MRQTFVDGGSETARLSLTKEDGELPKGRPVPPAVRKQIYTAHCLGEDADELAECMGLNPGTVRKIIRSERKAMEKAREDMARSGKIVKKDGAGGKLIALPTDGFEFTHVTPDGKSHRKKVPGHSARVAESQYDQWCQQLDDECEFMRKVERRPKEEGFVPTEEEVQFFEDEEPKAVCGYPGDPIEEIRPIQVVEPNPVPDIPVRPWREVAEERQRRIEELEARIAELEELAKADDAATPAKPVYVLWAKTDSPRIYGAYSAMEQALKKLDELNDVAAFLGNSSAFEVEEVAWRA